MIMVVLIGCSSQSNNIDRIKALETILYSDNNSVFDVPTAEKLVIEYELFADEYPEDTAASKYLFRGGELAMAIQSSEKAVELFGRIYNDYSSYKKAGSALFLIGMVNDDQLKNLAEAQKHYRKFIAEYPNHNLIEAATLSLQNLGKSPDDLMREIRKKEAEASAKDSQNTDEVMKGADSVQ